MSIKNRNYPTGKFDVPLAFQSGKCDNVFATLLLVRDVSVMGFMSGGMVAGSVSEGFCNYLKLSMSKIEIWSELENRRKSLFIVKQISILNWRVEKLIIPVL